MLELLSDLRNIIFPVFFVGFFLGTLVLLALSDREILPNRELARKAWVGGFILVLVAVTALGSTLIPIVEMHKFSHPSEEQNTAYEFVVVDADGNELFYDYRATPPTTDSRSSTVAWRMVDDYSDHERMETAAFYLSNAKEYRSDIESGAYPPPTDLIDPPRYVDDEQWTASTLEEYGEFESIRIYERTLTVNEDNTELESHDRRLLLTVDVDDKSITEHDNS